MSDLKNKALSIAQRYLGMQPSDLGCTDWSELNNRLADEIVGLINDDRKKNRNFIVVGAGDSGLDVRPLDIELLKHKPSYEGLLEQISKQAPIKPFDFSTIERNPVDINFIAKVKTEELLGETKKLKAEVEEIEEVGYRGVTNNRKIKKRKKAKNGKRKKK